MYFYPNTYLWVTVATGMNEFMLLFAKFVYNIIFLNLQII